jgi:hypothetical protein
MTDKIEGCRVPRNIHAASEKILTTLGGPGFNHPYSRILGMDNEVLPRSLQIGNKDKGVLPVQRWFRKGAFFCRTHEDADDTYACWMVMGPDNVGWLCRPV